MSEKSLKIHPDWIQEVKAAYRSRYSNQNELAEKADISSVDTVSKFLNGKAVKRANFWKLCDLLGIVREQVIKEMSRCTSSLDKSVNMVTIAEFSDCLDVLQSEVLGTGLETSNFIGRDSEVGYIHHLTAQGAKCILILGTGGVGKTTLARNYLKQSFDSYIEFSIAKDRQNIASIANLVEEKLKVLNEESGREFMISLERLKCRLQRERIGVLIDNLEPALDRNGQFVEEHRGYIELLRVLTDSSLLSTTLITSREPLKESLDIQILILKGLKEMVWKSFFSQQGIKADTPVLGEVHKVFGGNALAMKILCTPIKTYYDGDLVAYWRECKTESELIVEQVLENLISEQFSRLQSNCPEAYKLLCRMGCFRYQNVPTVPQEGLFSLLWDVTQERHMRLIRFLRDRALIEIDKGEYFLHPMIKTESISRLKASGEWKAANHEAAEFWFSYSGFNIKSYDEAVIKSYDEAMRIIESFEHFYTVQNWGKAFLVWKKAGYLRRFGYSSILNSYVERLSPMLSLSDMERLEKSIGQGINLYFLSEYSEAIKLLSLDNKLLQENSSTKEIIRIEWLCACYVDIGNFQLVIEHEDYAVKAGKKLAYKSQVYILNLIGVSYCNLCNYEMALKNHHLALDIANKKCDQSHVAYSLAYLAYCKFSQMEFLKNFQQREVAEISSILEKVVTIFKEYGDKSSEVIAKCYLAKLYLYEGKINLAQDLYKSACEVNHERSQKSSFSSPYLNNILLSTLAKFKFMTGEFHESLDLIGQSIALCEEMGTNFLLAESYVQLGLTYQTMEEYAQAQESKAKAIELFEQMEAPKQVDRVKQAFGENI